MAIFEASVVNPMEISRICINTSRIPKLLQEHKFNPTASVAILTDLVASVTIKT
jgi:hypothetical protein